MLTKIDRALFAGYCTSCAWWRKAQEAIMLQGPVYVTPKGKIETRPEIAIAQMFAEQMQSLGAEFGLSPTSRARMRFPQTDEKVDPMEALLREIEKEGTQ